MAKSALGRGLGALLGSLPAAGATEDSRNLPGSPGAGGPDAPGNLVQSVPWNRIRPSSLQPRKDFTPEALRELADSIREQGILQPLVVRPRGEFYELIAGERRWRAAQLAGLIEVPVLSRDADDPTVLELMLIENLQRENLNPIEEAQGYAQLIEQFHLRQEDAAQKVGRSRAVVANALRLLKLPDEVQVWLRDNRLTVGHAKAILGLSQADEQRLAAEKVLKDGLNVRQTEELVTRLLQPSRLVSAPPTAASRSTPVRDVHIADLENRLQQRLGTKVTLRYRQGKGTLEIRFFTDDDLQRVLELLGVKEG